MTAKETYRKFCQGENSLPLFAQDWWLDAVCGNDNWDVALVERGGEVFASMPYFIKRKYGFKLLRNPPHTPLLGPWLRPLTGKYVQELSRQNKLMNELIDQLPEYAIFSQSWHYSITNWLPFYWRGFSQEICYTYVIEDLSDTGRILNNFHNTVRTDIKKASRNNVYVRDDGKVEDITELYAGTLKRNGIGNLFDKDIIRRLYNACTLRTCGKIFIAEDKEGKIHSGMFMVWDNCSAYKLIAGRSQNSPNNGAMNLILLEGIKFASTVSKQFDFAGSMIQSIESFNRSFGGIQKPVFCVSKTDSILLRTFYFGKDILKLAVNKFNQLKHRNSL